MEWNFHHQMNYLKWQEFSIQIQNKLFTANQRAKDSLRNSISKMGHNHAEAVAMKEPVKLNLAMLEKA